MSAIDGECECNRWQVRVLQVASAIGNNCTYSQKVAISNETNQHKYVHCGSMDANEFDFIVNELIQLAKYVDTTKILLVLLNICSECIIYMK